MAFDLLWCDGQDLRYALLTERKHRLRSILQTGRRVLCCGHVERDGESLFRVACDNDLEGIVAKRKFDQYLRDPASWLKIRNTNYSQWEGCEELFDREREVILISRYGMTASGPASQRGSNGSVIDGMRN